MKKSKHITSILTPIDDILSDLNRRCDEMMWEGDYQEVDLKRVLEQIEYYQSEQDKGVIYEPNF